MRRLPALLLLTLAMLLALTAVASAGKEKPCDPWPSCRDETPPPTTIGDADPWTCVARARNGASAWDIGEWVATDGAVYPYFDRATLEGDPANPIDDYWVDHAPAHYRAYVDERAGVPACFDIHPAHLDVTTWEVAWDPAPGSFTNEKGKLGGLKMQFEREVHEGLFWDHIVRSVAADDVIASWSYPEEVVKTLVFVAMPSHRDGWSFDADHQLTVTPVMP